MRKIPPWFYFGIVLTFSFWAISWGQIKPLSYYSFFFIWLGYIFAIDGLNFKIKGWSMLSKDRTAFLFMFILGGIFWWYFEFVVEITKNWYYISSKEWGSGVRVVVATLFFSTFFISILETISLVINLKLIKPVIRFVKGTKYTPLIFFTAGIISIPITILFPNYFFPFLWITLFLILDPINYWAGRDSLLKDCLNNNWSRIFAIGLGGLITGVFWELWNYNGDPKWIYNVLFVDFVKVFEMPILGYLGYIPFAFEMFALYSLIQDRFGFPKDNYFVADNAASNTKTDNKLIIFAAVMAVILVNIFLNSTVSRLPVYSEKVESEPELQSFVGSIYYCGLGINRKGICLLTDNRDLYTIRADNITQFTPGRYQITGNLIIDMPWIKSIKLKEATALDKYVD